MQIAHCSALLPLLHLQHMDHCVHTTPSDVLSAPHPGAWPCSQSHHSLHGSYGIQQCQHQLCWSSDLSGKDCKRQWYGLIYLCNLLWLSLCLIPSTPHNFQRRTRLTAFQEDTSLWHKNAFTWWFSKTLFTHFDCRTNVQKSTHCRQTRRNIKKISIIEQLQGERRKKMTYEFQCEKWLVAGWLCQDNIPCSISP